jgi:predicted acyl esterase
MFGRGWRSAFVAFVLALCAPAAAQAAPPQPFGHPCTPQDGVLYCPTDTLDDRVPSFDGTPLDVDVTLPANAKAGQALPTIVMLHGYGGSKSDFESSTPEGASSTTYHYNNAWFARRGYAVLNYTARGFGRSCGKDESSASTPDCTSHKSYIHLADQRWEARDTQYLLGRLVDQRVTAPAAMGATGISYGGGQSTELAYLRNRIRTEAGGFAPWTSTKGTRLSLTAAWPRWPWSDLVDSLLPNGRFLDSGVRSPNESRAPLGVMKESYEDGLFALGLTSGVYCGTPPQGPPCTDPTADLPTWFARTQAGEPETADARAIADEIYGFHQGYGITGVTPAPLLMESGFTDDLFPPKESIRVYRDARRRGAPVSMQFGDLGHARGSNKANADHYFNDQGSAFFDRWLRGTSRGAPADGEVTAFTQTCPQDAPADGPFRARSYADLAGGSVRFGRHDEQVVTAAGGNPATGAAIDPVAGGGDACRQVDAETAPGTATVLDAPASRGFTLLGLPTVRLSVSTADPHSQLDSRLWDVGPDGKQTLISRGAYRLASAQQGRVNFQLHGNGWCFAPGHQAKLELLGADGPYLRPSNPPASATTVSDVDVQLPTATRQANGCAHGG